MVVDPADYRWSGYGEVMAGKARSRRGLVRGSLGKWHGQGTRREGRNRGARTHFRL